RMKDRKFVTESRVTVAYTDDTTDVAGKVNLDSVVKFRTQIGDSLKLVGANNAGQLFTFNTAYDYAKDEFSIFEKPLVREIDSLLHVVGIGASFAFKLSNFSGKGDEY